MQPEKILKTEWLDILFNNKNKAYGAYELRKKYPARLKKSLMITSSLVLVFAFLQSWRSLKPTNFVVVGDVVELANYKPIDEPKEKVPEKPLHKKQELAKQEIFTDPKITKTNITEVPTTETIDTSNIGKTKFNGTASTGRIGVESGTDTTGKLFIPTPITPEPPTTEVEDNSIYNHVSEMPEFIGGIEAMKRFLLRHLPQPDDFEEGTKITVIAHFVVNKNGEISNVTITQNGREDLDEAVIKAINKMPLWKPGNQNGTSVAVYFTLPVTFSNNQ